MKALRIVLTMLAVAMLYGGSVRAEWEGDQLAPLERREAHPGSAALAAVGNVLFVPVKVACTTVGAVLGGLTGWLTAGNRDAAEDIWHLPPFDGQTHLQPEMLYGEEPLMIGDLEYRLHVTNP